MHLVYSLLYNTNGCGDRYTLLEYANSSWVSRMKPRHVPLHASTATTWNGECLCPLSTQKVDDTRVGGCVIGHFPAGWTSGTGVGDCLAAASTAWNREGLGANQTEKVYHAGGLLCDIIVIFAVGALLGATKRFTIRAGDESEKHGKDENVFRNL